MRIIPTIIISSILGILICVGIAWFFDQNPQLALSIPKQIREYFSL